MQHGAKLSVRRVAVRAHLLVWHAMMLSFELLQDVGMPTRDDICHMHGLLKNHAETFDRIKPSDLAGLTRPQSCV